MQYHTLVGDMGSALSGGQKQRILLARAFYNDPAILFIDEGTAHVDPEAEQRIIEMLASLDITRCVVSHRASVSEFGGRILTVRDGQVSEEGTLQNVLSIISATRP
jgi:ATP-binding cassette, subfamily B, bacterial CvaB/MchF/RaxB